MNQKRETGDSRGAQPAFFCFEKEELPVYLREGCLNHLSNLEGFAEVVNDELCRGFVRNRVMVPYGAANLFLRTHGGYLMYLVDVTACMAGYTLGKHNVTQHVSLDFIRGVELQDKIIIEARVVHDGRTTGLIETNIIDSKDRLCVKATVNLFFVEQVDPKKAPPKPFLGRNASAI